MVGFAPESLAVLVGAAASSLSSFSFVLESSLGRLTPAAVVVVSFFYSPNRIFASASLLVIFLIARLPAPIAL